MGAEDGLQKAPDQNYGAAIALCLGASQKHKGTSFRVGENYLLTCAHVVKQCLGISKKTEDVPTAEVDGKTIEIKFSKVPESIQEVEIVAALWRFGGEDIAVLKLTSPAPDSVAVISLKQSKDYYRHKFLVLGFPENGQDGRTVTGEMFMAQPSTGRIQLEGTKDQGLGIKEGFSGSPVWDEQFGGVVGMTVARDEDEDTKIGFMIPYEKLKPVLQAIALFDLLLPEESVLEQHWRNAYRLASSRSDDLHTLQEAILKIQDVPPQLGEPSLPIEQFAAYFALVKFDFNVKDRIKEWLETQVEDVNTLLKYVAKKVEQKESASSNPHLIIWLDREESSDENDEKYRLEAYLIPDRNSYDASISCGIEFLNDHKSFLEDGKIGKSKLEELLPKCLQKAIDEALGYLPEPDPDKSQIEMQIEIFLPRQFLHLPIDCWDAEEVIGDVFASNPIGHSYRFVLRVIDRLRTINKNSIHNRWKEKWKISQQQTTLELIWWDFQDPISQFKFLAFLGGAIGWFRLQPTQFNSENNSCPFSALVGAGAPIAIWLRQESPNFASEFFKYFGVVAEKPGETPTKIPYAKNLPEKVRQLRRAASDRDDKTIPHIGEHIGLIWEDPKLIPPSFGQPSKEKRLRMAN